MKSRVLRSVWIFAAGFAALAAAATAMAALPCDSVITFATGNVPDREVFVAPTGSDSAGDGSRAKPFRTLSRGAQSARPGTAIRLLPGTHAGGAYLEGLAGRAEAPLWIGGVPGESRPVISGGGEGLHLTRIRHVVVENLEIAGATANGINCDDGGDYANGEACRFVVFRNLRFRDIGTGGNQDALKLSGVNDYWVLNCEFVRGSAGGSGIDHVGCHRGQILGCRFEAMGSNSIQCKGGSEEIEIRGCRFANGGQRAVNIGGSTGFQFFRPPLSGTRPNVEARRIRVVANLFQGSDAPVAFVGCVDSMVAHNTIVDPTRWVHRILQETVTGGGYTFLACGDSRFVNNVIYFNRALLSSFVNVGPNTAPASFGYANNLWYAHDAPGQSTPSLPTGETGGIRGQDPRFTDAAGGDFRVSMTSPAVGKGMASAGVGSDLDGRAFGTPPTIGAFEPREIPAPHSDADNLPDWWEDGFGLDRSDPHDAGSDLDLDGATNEREFLAGTDPRDAQSVLRILTFGQDPGGFWLRFPSVPERLYAVERASALGDSNWVDALEPGDGHGEIVEVRLARDIGIPARFFRIRARCR